MSKDISLQDPVVVVILGHLTHDKKDMRRTTCSPIQG